MFVCVKCLKKYTNLFGMYHESTYRCHLCGDITDCLEMSGNDFESLDLKDDGKMKVRRDDVVKLIREDGCNGTMDMHDICDIFSCRVMDCIILNRDTFNYDKSECIVSLKV